MLIPNIAAAALLLLLPRDFSPCGAEFADKPEATIPHDVAKRSCVEIRRI